MSKSLRLAVLMVLIPYFCFSQVQDSLVVKPKVKDFVIPVIFLSYGAISLMGDNAIRNLDYTTNNELREDHPNFALRLDNYLRYAPAVGVYALDLIGVKAKHNLVDRTAILAMSYVLVTGSVGATKIIVNRERPSGANRRSFPSGHTAMAFMTAEFLHQEYKDKSILYSIVGYSIATGTGIFRLYNNAHWVSDVVTGAGFGILSTKLSYWIYPYLKQKVFRGKAPEMVFAPSYQQGSVGFNLVKRF